MGIERELQPAGMKEAKGQNGIDEKQSVDRKYRLAWARVRKGKAKKKKKQRKRIHQN